MEKNNDDIYEELEPDVQQKTSKYPDIDPDKAKWYVYKNVFFMSLAFMLNYTSYSGLSGLQSSLHIIDGMGVICTSVRYVSLVISTFFLPELLIKSIGHKWTVTVSLVGFILWMAANGYGVWATMIPASIINGAFVASLWAAQGSYFTEIAKIHAFFSKQNQEGVIAMLFGIFYMFYLGAAIFGNIISTTVLKAAPPENYTELGNEEADLLCGLNDCPYNTLNNTNLEKPPDDVVWVLVGIYITIAAVAITISIFLVDNLPKTIYKKDDDEAELTTTQKIKNVLYSSVKLLEEKEMWLLIPITFYTGIEETFFFAEFNRSWITCALGIWMVGIINVPFGFTSAIVAYFCGTLTKIFGRIPLIIVALVLDLCVQFTLGFWTIRTDESWWYYTISFVWGLYDGIWLTITSALYGVIFPNDSEAAYSNYMCWQCLGYATAFGYSYFVCTDVKLYIMFASLLFGVFCYFLLEVEHRRKVDRAMELKVEEHDIAVVSDSAMDRKKSMETSFDSIHGKYNMAFDNSTYQLP